MYPIKSNSIYLSEYAVSTVSSSLNNTLNNGENLYFAVLFWGSSFLASFCSLETFCVTCGQIGWKDSLEIHNFVR